MDLKNIKWNKTNYKKFTKYLDEIKDKKYQEFSKRIIKNDNIKIYGIKIPKLKKIAKEISKGNYLSFIKYNNHASYEESIIHGLILGYIKVGDKTLLSLIDDFIPYIDNWAVCDTVCANTKQFKQFKIETTFKYLKSDNPWEIRFGLVLILDYFIDRENLNIIFEKITNISNDHYYVKMAISWLLSICYIKYPQEVIKFLKEGKLDKFTHNKTISKIIDSYRVDKIAKENIKKLKKYD